jgi:hypothetical protein
MSALRISAESTAPGGPPELGEGASGLRCEPTTTQATLDSQWRLAIVAAGEVARQFYLFVRLGCNPSPPKTLEASDSQEGMFLLPRWRNVDVAESWWWSFYTGASLETTGLPAFLHRESSPYVRSVSPLWM